MEFQLAQHADLPRIVAIYNQIILSRLAAADLEPVSVADREGWFASFTPIHPLWVIKQDEKIIGWAVLESFYGRPAYEHTVEISIYIDQSARHQGIGKQALKFVISQLSKLNITAIVTYIFDRSQPSLQLFKDKGDLSKRALFYFK